MKDKIEKIKLKLLVDKLIILFGLVFLVFLVSRIISRL